VGLSVFSTDRRAAVNIGSFSEIRDMVDRDDSRLKNEIDDIVAKINKTMKKIESVIPMNAPDGDTSGDEKNDPAPAVDDTLHEGSQSH
jgi:hypothetical protein